ncbi:AMP-binding protein [Pantoea ananatis]|uniref:AMP-binding protein n=1 Tax=Pantoea ananas TaxID=553 RepID=UPI0039B92289
MVIYTSGSTGARRGGRTPQRGALIHHIRRVAPTDRVMHYASCSFDTSVEELFPTTGATIVCVPLRWSRRMRRSKPRLQW